MCTVCLLTSALMMFTPAGDEVKPAQVSVAQETQGAIVEMVEDLPKSSDTTLLRQGLLTLHSRLGTTKNDTQAQNVINNELSALSQRLTNSPHAEEVTELLEDMLIEDEPEPEPLVKGVKYAPNKPQAKTNNWGWLR
ncbi:hypothetical protein [Aliterella atlantica]|uniref:Uncharacterized protein n=1 Tax=Aliterella atlantica CENA595 TaxID=1618023 RepID=A0A0D8ZQU6_9CYAN|nr:hypothetical protein [Aliterella atlantica]KJH70864.1 hypothetical protein UH38_15850 [Aliterella atlantica CENA595]